nr:unnamed protein product [Digitaria exilis]
MGVVVVDGVGVENCRVAFLDRSSTSEKCRMPMYPGDGSLGCGSLSQKNWMLLEALRGVTAVCITFDGASNRSLSMFCTLSVVDIEPQLVASTHGSSPEMKGVPEPADLDGVARNEHDGLRDLELVGVRDVHRGPEVDADVEVEDGRAAEAVVVAVHEGGPEEVFEPGHEGPERVAAARGVGEAAHVEVALAELGRDVLGRDVVVEPGVVDEGRVRGV